MSLGVSPSAGPDPRTAELRAMAHPVRLRILSLLTGAALTAADVARELGLTHANASYHLRQLLAVGQIEVAGHERIRGGAAKRYRYDASRHMTIVRRLVLVRREIGLSRTGPARCIAVRLSLPSRRSWLA